MSCRELLLPPICPIPGPGGSPLLVVQPLSRLDVDYYFCAPEYPEEGAAWIGRGVASSGHGAGPPTSDALAALMVGRSPAGRPSPEIDVRTRNRRHLGYDAVFSVPKSVSLLAHVGSAEVRQVARRSHRHSVSEAFAFLEGEASAVRRSTREGSRYLDSAGFAGAAFVHRTSRALDPHLHTHAVFANLGEGSDGRWTAFNSAFLWASARTAGFLYEARLRHLLTRDLGVEWNPVRQGTAELAGIPPEVLRHFSQRRQQIDAFLGRDDAGRDPASPAGTVSSRRERLASFATRDPKPAGLDLASLGRTWRERAAGLGVDEATVDRLIGRCPVPDPGTRGERLTEARVGVERAARLSDRSRRRFALRTACESLPPGIDPGEIHRVASMALASPLLRRHIERERRVDLGLSL